ncbi:MAG: tetratricopeptide repeat protein [Thermoanaerobaculum sp.]|nr:tetratricopeptide repeat protein [Thermoanaerobaculum sp.]MDW7967212.1 tetratricopeptide repeat protein [Thermoanaerobaculum sp.]
MKKLILPLAFILARGALAQENTSSWGFVNNLPPGRPAIFGFVTTVDGKPIANAVVEVYLNSEFRTDFSVTDPQGFYALALPQRSEVWEIRVKADGFLPWSTRMGILARERLDIVLREDPRPAQEVRAESKERRKARKLMQEGLEAAKRGNRAVAMSLLRQAVNTDPLYAAAANNLGVQLRLAGELSEAEAAFRQALQADSFDYFARFNLAALLYDTGRFHEAAPMAEQAVLADPTSAPAEALLGRCLLALGQAAKALEHFQRAQNLSQGALDLQLEISDALALSGRLAEALAAKKAWLAQHSQDPRAPQVQATIAKLEARLR